MKKKIFGGIAVLAIAALAAINVTLNSQNNKLSGLTLSEINAGAWSFWDGLENTFQGQGWTKDEREIKVECQSGSNTSGAGVSTGVSVSYGGVTVSTNTSANVGGSTPAGTSKITCGYGSDNCSSTDC
jgi:hypothetical protein